MPIGLYQLEIRQGTAVGKTLHDRIDEESILRPELLGELIEPPLKFFRSRNQPPH
jgi:hypothetical protein